MFVLHHVSTLLLAALSHTEVAFRQQPAGWLAGWPRALGAHSPPAQRRHLIFGLLPVKMECSLSNCRMEMCWVCFLSFLFHIVGTPRPHAGWTFFFCNLNISMDHNLRVSDVSVFTELRLLQTQPAADTPAIRGSRVELREP